MESNHQNDHDLLIELRTELRGLRTDVNDLKNGLDSRVKNLEDDKISKVTVMALKKEADIVHKDHESRIRVLEKWVWVAIGALGIIQVALHFIKL